MTLRRHIRISGTEVFAGQDGEVYVPVFGLYKNMSKQNLAIRK